MSIQGSLHSFSLMELFSSLLQWGKTGVLTVLSETEERGFLFHKGNLVYATSRDSTRRLGAFLVRLGYVTDEDIQSLTDGKGHIGQRLLETDRITQRQLRSAVKAQLLDIFLEVLRWEQGAFIFDDQELPFTVADGITNSTQRLLLEAATRMDELALSEGTRPPLARMGAPPWRNPRADDPDVAAAPGGLLSGMGSESGYPALVVDLAGQGDRSQNAGGPVPEIFSTTIAPDAPSKIFATGESEEEQICQVLGHEPMLAAKVLKVLALSNLKLQRSELSIQDFIRRLGPFSIRSILFPEAVRRLYFPRNQGYWREAWEHDQICAHLCEQIARKIGYPYPGEAYLAGLLHNLGMHILYAHNPEAYRWVVTTSLVTQRDVEALEKECFSVSHTRVGGVYAKKWRFPPTIQMAIKDHHRVGRKLSRPLLHMLHVANSVAYEYGCRVGLHREDPAEYARSLEALGLFEADLISLFIEARHRIGSGLAESAPTTA